MPAGAFTRQDAAALADEGFVLWRQAIPAGWLAPLRAAFEAGYLPSPDWPVPRGADWRHARLDTHPLVLKVCRLPCLLGGVARLLGGPFFLSQVEGRDPCPGNHPQTLHRDGSGHPPQLAIALAFLDAYHPGNGATQVIPGTHDGSSAGAPQVLTGEAGDVLLFDPDLLHGATTNSSGEPRRSLLITYALAGLRDAHTATRALRGVSLDYAQIHPV